MASLLEISSLTEKLAYVQWEVFEETPALNKRSEFIASLS